MTIFLIPKGDAEMTDGKMEADLKQLKTAMAHAEKMRKQGIKQPFIVTISDYDVFAIPGTVEKIQSDGDGRIKLDFIALAEISSHMLDELEK